MRIGGLRTYNEVVISYRRAALGLLLLTFAMSFYKVAAVGAPVDYAFIHAHPIDMDYSGHVRWFYYSVEGKPDAMIDNARAELTKDGFMEDSSNKPWYRFTSGNKEVVICDSGYAMMMQPSPNAPKTLIHYTPTYKTTYQYTDIYVREPGGSDVDYIAFQIKKRVLFW